LAFAFLLRAGSTSAESLLAFLGPLAASEPRYTAWLLRWKGWTVRTRRSSCSKKRLRNSRKTN